MANPATLDQFPTVFENVAAAWLAHPNDCGSLREFWFGRRGGMTCPTDISSCDGCRATFFVEGLAFYGADDDELCECCARKRGAPA